MMDENTILIDFSEEAYRERYELASERVAEFPGNLQGAVARYFSALRDLAALCMTALSGQNRNRALNEALYFDLTEEGYARSFLNPEVAARELGEAGAPLCVWYAEFRGLIPFAHENRLKEMTVLLETTIQLFQIFEEHADAVKTELLDVIYCYLYDYAEEFVADRLDEETDPARSFAREIVLHADLTDTGDYSYLYAFGEWITEEERMTARLMASLPEETVRLMASAYTEGYIRGFAATGKDIGKKSIVNCYLPLGFERFMREAIRQFEAAGLQVVLSRYPVRLINKKLTANIRPGFYGAFAPQCEYDHREDLALFWGDKLKARKLQALKAAYEASGKRLSQFSGNACVEIFGKAGFVPADGAYRPHFTEHQHAVTRDYAFRAHEIAKEYIPDEETSYTIIAWPTPSIAGACDGLSAEERVAFEARYRELFEKLIRINTLPSEKWQQLQQHLIDALDTADYVEVKGAEGSLTDIRVMLHPLAAPEEETNFENCVADVNIPVGEVFTSPVLRGTTGTINPDYVYIVGYLFRDLVIRFEDGRVCDYACANYDDPEQGRALIRKVIFHDREALPLGEFAIGTNTEAYAAARRYGIEDRMPVLIAEKTGPHFAVGDTCYSYEEDMVTYNPDGKRIIARENECSALRHTAPEQAYFQVHTDITLPYSGIASVTAVGKAGRTEIIRDGKYVLPGTEELNEALAKD